ncbi:bifunctional proline dehydrogenase/L-glutamate gamma-semialdehyde dehydrogenase PutA [bacterium]|nr:bifunctional proline dehydrogenase/L-glutamate gamma-semialdehyde dehydrogenase PutA [bacterium]
MAKTARTPAQTGEDELSRLRRKIVEHALIDEELALEPLIAILDARSDELKRRVHDRAEDLVAGIRASGHTGVEALLQEYRLDQREGVLIMCLAEALLRVPDSNTANRLIEDKFTNTDWERYLGGSESILVNASSWGLMLTGKIMDFDRESEAPLVTLRKLVQKMGAPIIRQVLSKAMEWMGTQFILGTSIESGVKAARENETNGYMHSYDMLGEGARTRAYAAEYAARYLHAIEVIGKNAPSNLELHDRPSISIKLSALHPAYHSKHKQAVMDELVPELKKLMLAAKKYNLMAAIDAEEAARLDLSLDIFEALIRDPDIGAWDGVSLVVQAYQKRALHVIHWTAALARSTGKQIPIRLVKGAYWDSEVKHAQVHGLEGYPVYTRKYATDLSYLACARTLLDYGKLLYPQFATHNAHTVASILEMAPKDAHYEFQRLQGMGGTLYDQLMSKKAQIRCRIYAPIGVHKDLLAYLVRRLLENGANSSFINQLGDKNTSLERLIADPVSLHREKASQPPYIPLPVEMYGPKRPNSKGVDLGYYLHIERLYEGLGQQGDRYWQATGLIDGKPVGKHARDIVNPGNLNDRVGQIMECDAADAKKAMDIAGHYFPRWAQTEVALRARLLRNAADKMEEERDVLMALILREGGRTLQDAMDEIREAVDFCRYYAAEAERLCGAPVQLPGPTGESNHLLLQGRGVFCCISPWNFPLAIFIGQIAAALATGNTVVAKPAEQTPIIAWHAVKLLHEAGIPPQALALIPGDGPTIGQAVLEHPALAGICFTGSTEVGKLLQRKLAERPGAILPLIAETGGMNAMIVDSTALPEQVADDVVLSAFGSAGQRCSALRLLFVQSDTASEMIHMIAGSLQTRMVGLPWELKTDIGPVIDADAKNMLEKHKTAFKKSAKLVFEYSLGTRVGQMGHYVAPTIFELPNAEMLKSEVFGPILHVVRYEAGELDKVIDSINRTGYGLTLGVHSRIDGTAQYIAGRVNAGNVYVNRSMIGAVVGVQPFGGMGLSGTGFKAGGPHYLLRFLTEKTLTVNTAAVGGNIALFTGN